MLKNFSKQNLHHTNICIGSREDIKKDIDECLAELSKSGAHVEYVVYDFDKFLLEDAKSIFSKHIHKVAENHMRIVCIACNSTNFQTQNSILKILEEPPQGTYFFILVPHKKILLPTILSRAQIFEYTKETEISKETKQFINSPCVKRLEIVKKYVDDVKNEKKTKQDIIEFIEEIEKYIHQKKDIKFLKQLIEIKEYMKDQGASIKQLLEYVSVML